ncbi:MAG TPA: polyprenol phosphomannose-dependent alpha 1,6 mannosyltransferase MptB [Mycobacteriales bacterium]|nr:polyprenol phosphomannose-dependent alpha 1,6 mannosyltransferase MptB [Mycobacteriales bacterium]
MTSRHVVPRRLLALGFLGTALLAFGGIGVGANAGATPALKDAVAELLHLNWLQDAAAGRSISLTIALAGLGLITAAWWRLRHVLDRVQPGTILLITGLWTLPLLIGPPLFSRDVYAYAGQGNLVAGGIDPYEYGPGALVGKWAYGVDSAWRFSPSPYGPVWLWLSGQCVALSHNHVVPAVFMLRGLAVLGLLMVAWALPRLARAHGVLPQRALWLGLANPFVLVHGIGGAHNDALMIGLLMAGLAVVTGRPTAPRLAVAAVLITVAALVKLPAIAALGFLPMLHPGWRLRVRTALLVTSVSAATGVLVTWWTGLGWGWVHTLGTGSARLSIFSPVTGIGVLVDHALRWLGVVETPGEVTRWVFALSFGIAGLVALTLLLRAHHLGAMRALGLAMVAVVALAPVVQPWYLLWGLVLLAAVGGERVLLALGALSVVLCLTLLPNGRSLVRPPFYGVPLVAAVGFAVYEVRRSARQVLEEAEADAAAVAPVVLT